MPLLGSIMTIDAAGSPTTVSTSVFDENMTWSRPTGGSTSSTNEAHSIDHAILTDEQQLHRLIAAATTTAGDRATTRSPDVDDQGPTTTTEQYSGTGYNDTGTTGTNVRTEEEEIARTGDCACERYGAGDIASESGRLPFLVTEELDEAEVADTSEGSTVDGFQDTTTGVVGVSTTDRVDVEGLRELELLFGLGGIMEDLGGFNDSFNDSLLVPCNDSLSNETTYVLGESMYPSGYTLPHIILASVLATLLMIVIVVGNMLVIIAIFTEKALKNIQNWFIGSLAVADFFLGLVIMPFSLANEIMGYWIFGYWWCDIYSAMDVWLCTASIMNLCLISLDRFWSITQAVEYLKKRTPARAAVMIALVWVLSGIVCIPPLLGWKRPTPAEEYPKCKLWSSEQSRHGGQPASLPNSETRRRRGIIAAGKSEGRGLMELPDRSVCLRVGSRFGEKVELAVYQTTEFPSYLVPVLFVLDNSTSRYDPSLRRFCALNEEFRGKRSKSLGSRVGELISRASVTGYKNPCPKEKAIELAPSRGKGTAGCVSLHAKRGVCRNTEFPGNRYGFAENSTVSEIRAEKPGNAISPSLSLVTGRNKPVEKYIPDFTPFTPLPVKGERARVQEENPRFPGICRIYSDSLLPSDRNDRDAGRSIRVIKDSGEGVTDPELTYRESIEPCIFRKFPSPTCTLRRGQIWPTDSSRMPLALPLPLGYGSYSPGVDRAMYMQMALECRYLRLEIPRTLNFLAAKVTIEQSGTDAPPRGSHYPSRHVNDALFRVFAIRHPQRRGSNVIESTLEAR
ncbi:Alpha-2C adrenergic receptor [Eufriesea mexicana]|uniref:Alpha-2C adrenergic receptor n=1 Tax=Eufriesea mexicana TaxID=516756 RepID=A0A310SMB1_9HYME|nr:Alpha-2C adrenergic receptor [Eufriesea mexicana]